MLICGKCGNEVKPVMGAVFGINDVYYCYPDCWPEDDGSIPCTWFRPGYEIWTTSANPLSKKEKG
jgi:hypothetical protein